MFGDDTASLVDRCVDDGASRLVVLMRHSARTYEPGLNDLLNPLTDEGREYARVLGSKLPPSASVRGYASPVERCMETAQILLDSHAASGGDARRRRPLEALGVFYALDQMRMWKSLQAEGGLPEYIAAWSSGKVPSGTVIPAPNAAALILSVLQDRLASPPVDAGDVHIDLCVSHDMTLYLMRDQLLGQAPDLAPVHYLDALVLFEKAGEPMFASHHAPPQLVAG